MIIDFKNYTDYYKYLESLMVPETDKIFNLEEQMLNLVKFIGIDKQTSMPTYRPYTEEEFNELINKF